MKTMRPTPGDIAYEQYQECRRWVDTLTGEMVDAMNRDDYAGIAMLHRNLAGVMRRWQERQRTEMTQDE